jgi:protein-S-isoprenylcysteine O-methyltransferase Ste14
VTSTTLTPRRVTPRSVLKSIGGLILPIIVLILLPRVLAFIFDTFVPDNSSAGVLLRTHFGWELTGWPRWIPIEVGNAILFAGIGMLLWSVVTFAREGVHLIPHKPERFITWGSHAYVQNMMILGVFTALIGEAVLFDWIFMLVVYFPAFVIFQQVIFIRPDRRRHMEWFEENYAAAKERGDAAAMREWDPARLRRYWKEVPVWAIWRLWKGRYWDPFIYETTPKRFDEAA